jgi:hypothetical protein
MTTNGTRHEVVSSTPVQSDGSFMLYPLATGTTRIPAEYDVVIHGPGIATIIIKTVQVFQSSSSTTPAAVTPPAITDASETTTVPTSGTTSTTPTPPSPRCRTDPAPRAATSSVQRWLPGLRLRPQAPRCRLSDAGALGRAAPRLEDAPIDPFNR